MNWQVVCRFKPPENTLEESNYTIRHSAKGTQIVCHVPRDPRKGHVNHLKQEYVFTVGSILNEDTTQHEVYEQTVAPQIKRLWKGKSGCVMAYGFTGSGKTYTMCGGQDFDSRGIIPRAVADVFRYGRRQPSHITYKMMISFLEIFNNHAYDLLDR